MRLVLPSVKYKKSYLQAAGEGKNEQGLTALRQPKEDEPFEVFVKHILGKRKGLNLPEGFVPATELWLVDKGEFVGRASIRHSLTEHLHKIGGHVGYYIRVSKRGQGYGKKILKMALQKAKRLGIDSALITCDLNNIPSAKVIEANGGVLESIVSVGKNLPKKKRYWIAIK